MGASESRQGGRRGGWVGYPCCPFHPAHTPPSVIEPHVCVSCRWPTPTPPPPPVRARPGLRAAHPPGRRRLRGPDGRGFPLRLRGRPGARRVRRGDAPAGDLHTLRLLLPLPPLVPPAPAANPRQSVACIYLPSPPVRCLQAYFLHFFSTVSSSLHPTLPLLFLRALFCALPD